MQQRMKWCLLIIFLNLLLSACNPSRFIVNSMNPLMKQMQSGVFKNDDPELIKEALPAALVMIDGLLEVSPDNKELLLTAAESYSGYAFAYIEDTNPERASHMYLKARNYALRVLKKHQQFQEALQQPFEKFQETLSKFKKADAPALFWSANCWFKWISLNLNQLEVFLDIPKAEAMLNRVLELDETYYFGSAHISMGGFYASVSEALGGNPQKAYKHFQRAFEIAESKFLLAHLFYAQFYAVQIQDRALFLNTLQNIIDTPNNVLPKANFINQLVKEKAKKLIQQVDVLF
ncbi:MAG: hypothetical protein HQK77_16465 [Desulfobacterales bacterium]|nr:hypothetical protein [Desulfobacterales bacterium]